MDEHPDSSFGICDFNFVWRCFSLLERRQPDAFGSIFGSFVGWILDGSFCWGNAELHLLVDRYSSCRYGYDWIAGFSFCWLLAQPCWRLTRIMIGRKG